MTAAPEAGRADAPRGPTRSRRELFALAAVLAATVLTAGAAIAGLTRKASAPPASTPTVNQIVNQSIAPTPKAPPRVEPGD